MNHSNNQDSSSPVFGFWSASALVVGNMIGSGILLLPSALALYGGISIIGWIFTTTGALLLSFVFMELTRRYPLIGGPYVFARNAFGDLAGFIVTYSYWISILCGNAAIAIALTGYLSVFFPIIGKLHSVSLMTSLVCLWGLTAVNVAGIRLSSRIQFTTALLKILLLFGIACAGLIYFDPVHFIPFNQSAESDLGAITSTAALTLWAFLGLESATIPADKIKDPERIIPRATLFGTAAVAVVYVLITVSIMGLLSPGELVNSNAPFADAIKVILGPAAGYITALIGVIACAGALNGWIFLQGQMPLAASLDDLFPSFFGKLSSRQAPVRGIVFSSGLISFLLIMNYTAALVEQFTFVILLATLATLLPYLISAMAQLKFNMAERKQRAIKISMIVTILAFIYSAWAVLGLGMNAIMWGVLCILTGIPIYGVIKTRGKV